MSLSSSQVMGFGMSCQTRMQPALCSDPCVSLGAKRRQPRSWSARHATEEPRMIAQHSLSALVGSRQSWVKALLLSMLRSRRRRTTWRRKHQRSGRRRHRRRNRSMRRTGTTLRRRRRRRRRRKSPRRRRRRVGVLPAHCRAPREPTTRTTTSLPQFPRGRRMAVLRPRTRASARRRSPPRPPTPRTSSPGWGPRGRSCWWSRAPRCPPRGRPRPGRARGRRPRAPPPRWTGPWTCSGSEAPDRPPRRRPAALLLPGLPAAKAPRPSPLRGGGQDVVLQVLPITPSGAPVSWPRRTLAGTLLLGLGVSLVI
mmetsp:Transcript_59618/g.144000  ORF Transcript_59618/g.144000 Transcript_59618/m.144000 type:complete len:311 (-) Transcript_59618:2323-3255(-)